MHLVIDDEPDRKPILLRRGLPEEHIWVTNLNDAMPLIREASTIWLDHDLGGLDTTMIIVQTFAELVFHEEIETFMVPSFIIHTANPVGRQNLIAVCERWGFNFAEAWM